jgi:hypothetical protein
MHRWPANGDPEIDSSGRAVMKTPISGHEISRSRRVRNPCAPTKVPVRKKTRDTEKKNHIPLPDKEHDSRDEDDVIGEIERPTPPSERPEAA